MADVKWIKIATDIFDNRKIKMLETMPDGDSIIVIWFKLLSLAGSVNDNGCVYFTKDLAYTPQMLATAFNRPQTTVDLALKTFKSFGMIDIVDDLIYVSNWQKYQNIDGMEKIREQGRLRQAKRREKLKLECKDNNVTSDDGNVTSNVTCNVTVTESNDTCNGDVTESNVTGNVTVTESNDTCNGDVTESNVTGNVTVTHGNALDIDIDIDKDIDKEKELINTKIKIDRFSDLSFEQKKNLIAHIQDEWNTLAKYGIARLEIFEVFKSERGRNLVQRLDECGVDTFDLAIREIKMSKYLQGETEEALPIRFEWLVESKANYEKVYKGVYRTRKPKKQGNNSASGQKPSESVYDNEDFKELESKLIDN